MSSSNANRDYGPVYWFAILTQSLKDGDLANAAHAQKALDSLGYVVRIRQPKTKMKSVQEATHE